MTENMPAPLRAQLTLLEGWSGGVRNDLARFVEANKDIPFIEDILSDCDAYGIAVEEVISTGLKLGTSEHQAELFFKIISLMTTAFNVGTHHGTITHVDLREDPKSRKSLSAHLESARDVLTPVTTIKKTVVKEKTQGLWERQKEYIGNVRGTALTIMRAANEEIHRRCNLLNAEDQAGKPDGDLGLTAMMKWVRRAQSELMEDGRFASL